MPTPTNPPFGGAHAAASMTPEARSERGRRRRRWEAHA